MYHGYGTGTSQGIRKTTVGGGTRRGHPIALGRSNGGVRSSSSSRSSPVGVCRVRAARCPRLQIRKRTRTAHVHAHNCFASVFPHSPPCSPPPEVTGLDVDVDKNLVSAEQIIVVGFCQIKSKSPLARPAHSPRRRGGHGGKTQSRGRGG